MDWGPVLIGLVSVAVPIVGVLLVWLQWRERQMRMDDVLHWASDTIRTLQTVYLACYLGERLFGPDEMRAILQKAAVDTSVSVEQGRLFFRNTPDPEHGKERHPAYRGYRPELLDPVVVAHQIACQWSGADEKARLRMTLVAEDCVKRFVSFAQLEVGRSRTVSADAGRKGEGETLPALMGRLSVGRIEKLKANGRQTL
jgi:hypothetical protein